MREDKENINRRKYCYDFDAVVTNSTMASQNSFIMCVIWCAYTHWCLIGWWCLMLRFTYQIHFSCFFIIEMKKKKWFNKKKTNQNPKKSNLTWFVFVYQFCAIHFFCVVVLAIVFVLFCSGNAFRILNE